MRVLHLITVSEAGGAQSVVAELANGLVEAGHEAAVASDSGGVLWDLLDRRVRAFEIPFLQKKVEPRSDLRAFLSIRKALRAYNPDILHLHSSKAGVLGRVFPGRRRSRIVYTVHGFDTIRKAHRAYLPVERFLSGSCGAIVAVSDYDRKGLEECGIRRNVRVIPNGIVDPTERIAADPSIVERFRKDREAGNRIVLSVARLSPPKRFDLFRDLAESMEGESVRFYWIGGGSVPARAIPDNLRMLGEVRNAAAYIGECDVFMLLSDFEGLPMSVLEALSWGKPVIASRVGGIPEELGDGAGILVDNDLSSLRKELEAFIGDAEIRETLGKSARKRYLERYESRKMTERYISLYNSLTSIKQS